MSNKTTFDNLAKDLQDTLKALAYLMDKYEIQEVSLGRHDSGYLEFSLVPYTLPTATTLQ